MNNPTNVSTIAAIEQAWEVLVGFPKEFRSASKFITPKLVVTLTRRVKPRANARAEEFVLVIGKPNFRGRAFVKACQQAGEPFPVKKVQVRRWVKAS